VSRKLGFRSCRRRYRGHLHGNKSPQKLPLFQAKKALKAQC
jgi:hypothetical protein